MNSFHYIGGELELFKYVYHWKSYLAEMITPYVTGDVLEVGAGCGTNTVYLCHKNVARWTCLEPDKQLVDNINIDITMGNLPVNVSAVHGTLVDLPQLKTFDTILYIDVLEHIEDHNREVLRAAGLLSPAGHLIVLVPAHQWLMSPFDRSVGHYRRYDRKQIKEISPSKLSLKCSRYLDSMGIMASLGNKLFLSKSMPSRGQLRFWDSRLVPISRKIDPLFGYHLGKSLLTVWVNSKTKVNVMR